MKKHSQLSKNRVGETTSQQGRRTELDHQSGLYCGTRRKDTARKCHSESIFLSSRIVFPFNEQHVRKLVFDVRLCDGQSLEGIGTK